MKKDKRIKIQEKKRRYNYQIFYPEKCELRGYFGSQKVILNVYMYNFIFRCRQQNLLTSNEDGSRDTSRIQMKSFYLVSCSKSCSLVCQCHCWSSDKFTKWGKAIGSWNFEYAEGSPALCLHIYTLHNLLQSSQKCTIVPHYYSKPEGSVIHYISILKQQVAKWDEKMGARAKPRNSSFH